MKLESFLKFLISRGFVDNEDDSSETIHRFLEIFEQFEEDGACSSSSQSSHHREDGEESVRGAAGRGVTSAERRKKQEDSDFETRAIFTLADFLKSLGPNEFYDIAQRVFN